MLKRLLKKICYNIYQIGRFEQMRVDGLAKDKYFQESATISQKARVSEEAIILNSRKDRSKIKVGDGSSIMGHLYTFDHGGEILIGNSCFVGPMTRIWSASKIVIGNRVLIAHNVNIHDNISHPIDSQLRHQEFENFFNTGIHGSVDLKPQDVIIEDDVWIGFNSIILKGVTIGQGAIIGAGSLVTKDVEPWTINVGNPLRCIEKINSPR
jgi:acetyltransferase-like isoleucine patch superfamily enzyme